MPGPLSGIRLIEMSAIGPVRFAGMLLADLGADVIRVDRPTDRLPSAPGQPERVESAVLVTPPVQPDPRCDQATARASRRRHRANPAGVWLHRRRGRPPAPARRHRLDPTRLNMIIFKSKGIEYWRQARGCSGGGGRRSYANREAWRSAISHARGGSARGNAQDAGPAQRD